MKNFLLVITLLIVTNLQLSAQWSTDPNNNLIVGYGLDPHICSDSAGGCYITYDYHSTSYPRWLAIERLDKYGFKPWGINEQILGESPEQSGAEIIEDGEGGIIISFIDRYENLPYWTQRVRVQKVDSNGNFLWGPTGVKVTLDEINQGSQKIVNDGVGGAVVIWVNTQAQYKVNRISSDGQRMWGDSGIVAGINGWYDPALIVRTTSNKYVVSAERNTIKYFDENGNAFYNDSLDFWLFNIISDGIGGIVLSGKVWNGMIPKLVAQRIDSLGNNLWQEPYVEIADSLFLNTSLSIKENNGYFYYGWTGKRNGIDKVAQFQALRLDGTKLFLDGSIQVGTPPLNGTIVQQLEEDRTAFVYYNSDFLPDSLLVQTYDTTGNKTWNEDGILIAHPPIEYQSYTTDGNEGFIIGGIINNFTIVAQQVSKYGNLGEVIIPVELTGFYANVNKDKIELFWLTATEKNNSGFEIQRKKSEDRSQESEWEKIEFVPGFGTTTEPKSYSFADGNVTTGTYKYRLKQIDFDGSFEYSNEIEVEVDFTPKEFVLYQNYPNPFNPVTTIKYDIIKVQDVKVTIYDILGREVKTVVNEQQQPGSYTIKWDASNVSSGVYFYQLKTKDYINTKKMILVK